MKIVNRRKKEEADKRFGDLIRKQVNDRLQAQADTASADTVFAQLEDATVRNCVRVLIGFWQFCFRLCVFVALSTVALCVDVCINCADILCGIFCA
jgi:predicted transcriptional regulator